MGQGTDRDNIHPGLSDPPHGSQVNAPRGLDQGPPVDQGHGLAHGGQIHIVEHDHPDLAGQALLHLNEGIGFDLDIDGMGHLEPHPLHRFRDRAAGRDVVILDQHPVA